MGYVDWDFSRPDEQILMQVACKEPEEEYGEYEKKYGNEYENEYEYEHGDYEAEQGENDQGEYFDDRTGKKLDAMKVIAARE